MNKLSKALFVVAGLTLSTGVLAENNSSDGGPRVGDTAPAPLADSPPGTPNTYKEGEENKGSSPYKDEEKKEQQDMHKKGHTLENSNEVQQGDVVQPLKEDHE